MLRMWLPRMIVALQCSPTGMHTLLRGSATFLSSVTRTHLACVPSALIKLPGSSAFASQPGLNSPFPSSTPLHCCSSLSVSRTSPHNLSVVVTCTNTCIAQGRLDCIDTKAFALIAPLTLAAALVIAQSLVFSTELPGASSVSHLLSAVFALQVERCVSSDLNLQLIEVGVQGKIKIIYLRLHGCTAECHSRYKNE